MSVTSKPLSCSVQPQHSILMVVIFVVWQPQNPLHTCIFKVFFTMTTQAAHHEQKQLRAKNLWPQIQFNKKFYIALLQNESQKWFRSCLNCSDSVEWSKCTTSKCNTRAEKRHWEAHLDIPSLQFHSKSQRGNLWYMHPYRVWG